MDIRWTQIMNGISYVKPECIDKESLLATLKHDLFYDEKVLDSLYSLKFITLDEYIEFMRRLSENEKGHLKWIEDRIKAATEQREKYNPMIYYDLNSIFQKE